MSKFVQLVEFETCDIDALRDAPGPFRREHPEVMTSTTMIVTADRDRPGTYVVINEFDSYEKAMAQSNYPLTAELSQLLSEKMAGRQFRNLDVRDELSPA
ncbi:MAG: hypothetical protein ACRDYB_03930 [Acidimicrobiales bacterium]